ncbi:hypothetical protein QN277_012951 [Acacia crassicarpa]|uniref:Transmembrane protein n=1 Tax=Acacia crassicarpa TaxID=499986 RepID=A0AAE1N2K0_9FABA|nr:hypothetical protein QN277_012951 [Acacia crassicarpa]
MELSSAFFLFLLLSLPFFSADSEETASYEIDYRGPETHSSNIIPPPHHSHSSPSIQGEKNHRTKKLH